MLYFFIEFSICMLKEVLIFLTQLPKLVVPRLISLLTFVYYFISLFIENLPQESWQMGHIWTYFLRCTPQKLSLMLSHERKQRNLFTIKFVPDYIWRAVLADWFVHVTANYSKTFFINLCSFVHDINSKWTLSQRFSITVLLMREAGPE